MKKKLLYRKTKRLTVRPFELKDYAAWKMAQESTPKAKNRWDLNPVTAPTKSTFKKLIKNRRKTAKSIAFTPSHYSTKTEN